MGVSVDASVGDSTTTRVAVIVGIDEAVGLGESVGLGVEVRVGVAVEVGVTVGVSVSVGDGEAVAVVVGFEKGVPETWAE